MTTSNIETQGALTAFSHAATVQEAAQAATRLIKTKAVFSSAESDEFRNGLNALKRWANGHDERSRLIAISNLERLGSVLKRKRVVVDEILKGVLATKIVGLDILLSSDDRFYVSKALTFGGGDWVLEYAARECVQESAAEKARLELARIIRKRTTTLEDLLLRVARPFSSWQPDGEKKGDAAARRLKRVLAALRSVVADSVPGDGVGAALGDLVRAAFKAGGSPDDLKVAREATEELGSLIHDLVRSDVPSVTDARIYGVLSVPRRWFPLSSWPQYVARSKAMAALSRDLTGAITLLVRQGVTDHALFECLELVTGSREKALGVTSAIVDAHPELPPEIQIWLRKGRLEAVPEASKLVDESGLLRADSQIAALLIEAHELSEHLRVAGDLTGFSGSLSKSLSIAGRLVEKCKAVATNRDIRLLGVVGEEMQYSPARHALLSGDSAVRVVVKRPGAERVSANGISEVLVKAIVESAVTH